MRSFVIILKASKEAEKIGFLGNPSGHFFTLVDKVFWNSISYAAIGILE